ncbi:MAG TPA: MFS transporter, partial [Afifellaceae bacterium]|nr:MFS transporter [Afifellaceae bacterium]
ASPRLILALGAGMLMSMMFGSLYAWSLFIPSLEQDLKLLRTDISFVFSVALFSFAAGHFCAAFIFGRLPTALLPLLAAGVGGAGLALAGMGSNYESVVFGLGVLFGLSAGIAYASSLQAAESALPNKQGLAGGIIILSFMAGTVIAAYLFSGAVATNGVRATFWISALCVAATGVVAAILLALSGVKLTRQTDAAPSSESRRMLGISWVGFFLGAFAGIIAIGHAATIVIHFGGPETLAVTGIVALAGGIAAGRLFADWLNTRISVRSVAGLSHLTAAIGVVVVLGNPSGEGAVITLAMVGIAFGMTTGVYTSALSPVRGQISDNSGHRVLLSA